MSQLVAEQDHNELTFSDKNASSPLKQFAPSTSKKASRKIWLSGSVITDSMRVADCLIVFGAGLLAMQTRTSVSSGLLAGPAPLVIGLLLVPSIFGLAGLYRSNRATWSLRLVSAYSTVVVAQTIVAFISDGSLDSFDLWLGLWFLYGLIGLLGFRSLVYRQIDRWRRAGHLTRNLVIVGAAGHVQRLADQLQRGADPSIRLVGMFYDFNDGPVTETAAYSSLGGIDDLFGFACNTPVDQAIIAVPWNSNERLTAWIKALQILPTDILLYPPLTAPLLAGGSVVCLSGIPLLKIYERPLSGWAYIAKSIEDRVLASILLLICGPLMLLIALLVRLDSPGPVLFRQKRQGFNNAVFEVLKFRTMYAEVSEYGTGLVRQATRQDPRVTRVGGWLRRTSLDELPQLMNVIKGEMSIVGPRPHAVAHNQLYVGIIDGYLARHRVKPGITGWAQVQGCRGETDTVEKMQKRIALDHHYIENWSILFDFYIIALTPYALLFDRNAY